MDVNGHKEIADRFANYFEQVPHNVCKKLPSKVSGFTNYLPKALQNSMFFKVTVAFTANYVLN